MRSSQYKDFLTAQFDVSDAIDLIIEGRLDYKTGKRYINRISTVEADEDSYKFAVKDIFKYDHEKQHLVPIQCISDSFFEKLLDYGMPFDNVEKIKEIFNPKAERTEKIEKLQKSEPEEKVSKKKKEKIS
jgi:hypothetical protein